MNHFAAQKMVVWWIASDDFSFQLRWFLGSKCSFSGGVPNDIPETVDPQITASWETVVPYPQPIPESFFWYYCKF